MDVVGANRGKGAEPLVNDGRDLATRQRFLIRNVEAALSAVRAVRQATTDLYAALTPAQRTVMDRLDLEAYRARRQDGAGAAGEAVEAYPAAAVYPTATRPDWLIQPSGAAMERLFPSRRGAGGHALLVCMVNVAGYLREGSVKSEDPAGHGFGNAALIATAYMRMEPARAFGVPTYSVATVPIRFEGPDAADAQEAQGGAPPQASAGVVASRSSSKR